MLSSNRVIFRMHFNEIQSIQSISHVLIKLCQSIKDAYEIAYSSFSAYTEPSEPVHTLSLKNASKNLFSHPSIPTRDVHYSQFYVNEHGAAPTTSILLRGGIDQIGSGIVFFHRREIFCQFLRIADAVDILKFMNHGDNGRFILATQRAQKIIASLCIESEAEIAWLDESIRLLGALLA